MRTFSKAYGLAGFRVGYAVAPEPIAAALRAVSLPFGVSGVAQAAAVASLAAEDALLERVEALVAERDRVVAGAARRGLGRARAAGQLRLVRRSATAPPSSRPPPTRPASWCARSPARAPGSRIGEPEANDRVVELAASFRAEPSAARAPVGPMPYVEKDHFNRDMNYVPDRITRDGRDGWPVEPGRYRLVAAKACPWATRAIIVRQLLGLEDVISLGMPGPVHDEDSWTFDLDEGGRDPVLGIERLQEAYVARFPDYPRGITVPAMVDVPTGQLVTNDFPWITHDFFFEWSDHHREGAPDLWPAAVREEMEDVMQRVFTEVNNGVYRCGFAGTQGAYDEGLPPALGRDGLARGAAGRPALPHGRHDHRGRRTPLHDPGPFRRGLPRPLQVQPAEADRAAAPVGLRPRPVPDARVRREHRLRPDQGALLRRPERREPDRRRPEGTGPRRLAGAARPRLTGHPRPRLP